jgi:farnesol dehydrogenase
VIVLVTGGTGYLGQAVVRDLLRARHGVILFGRTATTALTALPAAPGKAEARAVDGDIRDLTALTSAARGCDALIHMAALVAVWRRDAREFDAVNVRGLQHVLLAAHAVGVRRIVYTASFLARLPEGLDAAPAWNDYQRTKAAADELAARAIALGAPLVRLYPGVVYGPGPLTDGNLVGRQIADHLAGRLPGVVGGHCVWSFAHVDDVAAAHVAALDRGDPRQFYDLGGVNAPQMRMFEIVRDLTGRPLPRRLPAWAVAAGAVIEEARALAHRPPLVTTGTLEILLRDWPLGHDAAARDLGYRVTPLDAGVRATVAQVAAGAPPH